MAKDKTDEKAAKKEEKAEAKEPKEVKKEKKTAARKPRAAAKKATAKEEKAETKTPKEVKKEQKTAEKPNTAAAKKVAVKEEKSEATEQKTAEKTAVKSPRTKKKPRAKREEYWATGRRKESVARLRLIPGEGNFELNGRSLEEYFGRKALQNQVKKPLNATKTLGKFDVLVNIRGGGTTGQAEAIQLGVARALAEYDETFRETLKKIGLLTRDSREKERRKYGLKKARKAPQFSKR